MLHQSEVQDPKSAAFQNFSLNLIDCVTLGEELRMP